MARKPQIYSENRRQLRAAGRAINPADDWEDEFWDPPDKFAQELVSVQPMDRRVGTILYLEFVYGMNRKKG